MNRVYLHTPIMNISMREIGRWCMYDEGILRREWMALVNQNYKFVEEYFPEDAKDIFEDPYRFLDNPADVKDIVDKESRNAFGTMWNRSFFILTKEVPNDDIWLPNGSGSVSFLGDIKKLMIMIMCQRIFSVFQEKFPRMLKPLTPDMPNFERPSFNQQKPTTPTPVVNYMQISRAYPVPFTEQQLTTMDTLVKTLAQDFAFHRNGRDDALLQEHLQYYHDAGFRMVVPDEGIKSYFAFPGAIPIITKDSGQIIPTQVRYVTEIYREDKLWKHKGGNMIPYSFMEMWYKILEKMEADKAANFTIVLLYSLCPDWDVMMESSKTINEKEK